MPCAANMALQDIGSDRALVRVLAMGSKVRDLQVHFHRRIPNLLGISQIGRVEACNMSDQCLTCSS